MIDNNYNLNYYSKKSEPPVCFAAHSSEIEFMEILLKNKQKFNLNVVDPKFGANALEIAVWRDREKIVDLLINAGMKFSIKKYEETNIGKMSIPFEKVSNKVKSVLVKRFVFEKTMKQLNMIEEFKENKNKLKPFENAKIVWDEYLDYIS